MTCSPIIELPQHSSSQEIARMHPGPVVHSALTELEKLKTMWKQDFYPEKFCR